MSADSRMLTHGDGADELARKLRTIGAFLSRIEVWLVVGVAVVVLLWSSHMRSTFANNYVFLADAFLHGRVTVGYHGYLVDALLFEGKYFMIEGPVPAFLMMPFVFLGGMQTNQTMVAIAIAATAMLLAWMLFERLGVRRSARLWLCLFVFAGTDLWWCAELGDVWFMAHVTAVAFALGALTECTGKRRGWLVGLLALGAVGSRFTAVLALPLYAYLIASGDLADPRHAVSPNWNVRNELRNFGLVLGLGLIPWIAYNEVRWHVPYDIGYTLFYHTDAWGQKTGSPFDLSYFPYEVYAFFFRGPTLVEWMQHAQAPVFNVDKNGIALTFTSPALILAFLAPPSRLRTVLWATAIVVAAPLFFYYLNGWYQFGMRHALDFEPFLFALMALGVRGGMPRWGAILCGYSAGVGTWGIWWWNVFMRPYS